MNIQRGPKVNLTICVRIYYFNFKTCLNWKVVLHTNNLFSCVFVKAKSYFCKIIEVMNIPIVIIFSLCDKDRSPDQRAQPAKNRTSVRPPGWGNAFILNFRCERIVARHADAIYKWPGRRGRLGDGDFGNNGRTD